MSFLVQSQDNLAEAWSMFADERLETRKYIIQIGESTAAVLSPNPAVTDLSAQDIEAIGGGLAGEGNAPSFGFRLIIPLEQLKATIAAGLAERQGTLPPGPELDAANEFYQYSLAPGTCLSSTPTALNPQAGARWLVTHDTGEQFEYYFLRSEFKHMYPYVAVTLLRAFAHGGRSPLLL